ncbi:MAG: ANTAR domain-containing protein [Pseudomonadota bacterium]
MKSAEEFKRSKIVVIDAHKERAFAIVDSLRDAGSVDDITVIGQTIGLARKLAELDADIILIDLQNPSRDQFEQIISAVGPSQKPVAMFVDDSDAEMTKSAIDAGVSAYVVDGLRPDRVRAVLQTAMARFHSYAKMRAELDATKAALAERKTVDRAKGVLMSAKGLSEEAAYALLRKTAMDQGKRISEVAEGIVTAARLLS